MKVNKTLEEKETTKPASIFRLTSYEYRYASPNKRRYPCIKLGIINSSFHLTLKEAEKKVADKGLLCRSVSEITKLSPVMRPYAYVITEIPLGVDVNLDLLGQSLSERIYNPDGTLWGKRDFCNFIPLHCMGEEYNYWGRLGIFKGRNPDEIKFMPGDIVEVFGYSGNDYWSNEEVNLSIVTKRPPTTSEMKDTLQQYFATHSGHDICDHTLCYKFGHREDVYEVLSMVCEGIDHSPTIALRHPSQPVSTRMRNRFQRMYQEYLNNKNKQKINGNIIR